jgi:pyruvate dehydrogenase E2 component (dihydrolipoamide acetyltransferase)
MHKVEMPQASKSMQDGTVRRWLKAAGQRVEKGELLLEIDSGECLIQAEASVAGTLREILVPAGKTVKIQTPLAVIAEGDGETVTKKKDAGETPGLRTEKAGGTSAVRTEPSSQSPIANRQSSIVIPILMPQAGQSMEEGTILKWRVKVGDAIAKGQIIFDVETDKATVEVEATDAGRLARIVVNEGQTMAVKKAVAFLGNSDADLDAFIAAGGAELIGAPDSGTAILAVSHGQDAHATALNHGLDAHATISAGGRVKASPAARKIAQERNLDLAAVATGSGPGGRILSTDVAHAKVAPASVPVAGRDAGSTRRRLSKMRRAIANNLQISKQTIPHFYAKITITADALFAFYREQKPKAGCSLNDVVTLAVAHTIREIPAFRSQLDKDEIVEFPHANIGIAVGIDDGLVVPVLVGADQMSLAEVAANSRRIVENARAGKLEGTGKGNFTITNLGMFGTEEFSAIINPPEPAILAVGAVRESVVVKDGAMRAGRVMTVTLSCDHRVIDGVLAAKFLARLKEILEAPTQLL